MQKRPIILRSLLIVATPYDNQDKFYCDQNMFATHCNALQRTAMHCNALHRTATHCTALQRTATHCNRSFLNETFEKRSRTIIQDGDAHSNDSCMCVVAVCCSHTLYVVAAAYCVAVEK